MTKPMPLIVVGTSNGGLNALRQILPGLPADFPAAILVVMHIGSRSSYLPEILTPLSSLPVRYAVHGEPLSPGVILIAPPDYHLLVEPGRVVLSQGPKENYSRPAIDPLFRTAASAYRERVIGVILSGDLDDGTIGMQAIRAYGGRTLVQNPAQAEAPSMPTSVMEYVDVDLCLPLNQIADALVDWVRHDPERAPNGEDRDVPVQDLAAHEQRFVAPEEFPMDDVEKIGTLSAFTCPECHGSLWEIRGASPQRFRCHTGHGFTARTLASLQDRMAEEALWAAVRALHERQTLLRQMANAALEHKNPQSAQEYAAMAERVSQQAAVLRELIAGSAESPS